MEGGSGFWNQYIHPRPTFPHPSLAVPDLDPTTANRPSPHLTLFDPPTNRGQMEDTDDPDTITQLQRLGANDADILPSLVGSGTVCSNPFLTLRQAVFEVFPDRDPKCNPGRGQHGPRILLPSEYRREQDVEGRSLAV